MHTVSRHTTFFDVLETLAKPGCVICSLVARTRWRYLDALAYENVNDYGLRVKIREALGFCNRHAWYFVETTREVFGATIIYRDVLHSIQRAAANGDVAALTPGGTCPACLAEWEATTDYLQVLAEALDEADMSAAYAKSDGLCGPHLLSAMNVLRPSLRQKLLERTFPIWQRDGAKPSRIGWQAVGAEGNFSTDTVALASPERNSPAIPPIVPGDQFSCPVCLASRALIADPSTWANVDEAGGGLCNVHAWHAEASGHESLFRHQLTVIGKRVEVLAASTENRGWLRDAVHELTHSPVRNEPEPLPTRCVVCRQVGALEATMVADSQVKPLCLPHLRRAIARRDAAVVETMKPVWRELDYLLGENLRKEDYRFRAEPRGEEQKSPRWAVSLISGAPGVR